MERGPPNSANPAYNNPVSASISAAPRQILDLLQSTSHVDDQGKKYRYVTASGRLSTLPSASFSQLTQRSLEVEQQPVRARMCGFGDKVSENFSVSNSWLSCLKKKLNMTNCVQDRRPITPPPCIRLVVVDARTGQAVDIKYVMTAPIHSQKALFVLPRELTSLKRGRHLLLRFDS